ncbi:MAG: LytR/AlgR family response regulator transcription factor [Betaproteobacteria bacterium]
MLRLAAVPKRGNQRDGAAVACVGLEPAGPPQGRIPERAARGQSSEAGSGSQMACERALHHLQHQRDPLGLRGQQHAQRDRQGQHPLPHGYVRDDVVHQVRRGLRHAPRSETGDGDEALAQLLGHAPDIAFLDIRYPGTSGIEIARRFSGKVHVVFVTAHQDFAIEAFERGAVDYEAERQSAMPARDVQAVPLVVANARHIPRYVCALRLDYDHLDAPARSRRIASQPLCAQSWPHSSEQRTGSDKWILCG